MVELGVDGLGVFAVLLLDDVVHGFRRESEINAGRLEKLQRIVVL
jgi:hypothetical protein